MPNDVISVAAMWQYMWYKVSDKLGMLQLQVLSQCRVNIQGILPVGTIDQLSTITG